MDSFEVAIPTFVNPHLFWIVESKNRDQLETVQKLLQEIKVEEPDTDTSFEVGEIVAVYYNKKYYRAVIEDIQSELEMDNTYLCWLLDYGIMLEASTVCKLPTHIRRTKPLAMQASLNDVVYIQQYLSFDEESGQPKRCIESVTTPTSLAHQVTLELMLDAKDIQFVKENKVEGILLGDVVFQKDGERKSLRQGLIDKGVLMLNEILFPEILNNVYTYKETHLVLILQICKKLNLHEILENNKCKTESQNIISKYLAEFDNRDIFDDDEVLQPFTIRRRRRKQVSNNSSTLSNTLNSETDSISDGDYSKKLKDLNMNESNNGSKKLEDRNLNDSNDSSKKQSAKQKLLELVKARKQGSLKANRDDSSISVEKESSSDGQSSPEFSNPTAKTPVSQEPKKVVSRNIIFQPAGATFTLINKMVTSTPKTRQAKTITEKLSSEKLSSEDTDHRDNRSTLKLRQPKMPSEDSSTTDDAKSNPKLAPSVEPLHNANQMNIKPHCSCIQCDHWTNATDWQTKTKFDGKAKVQHSPLETHLTLFREDGSCENARRILSLDYSEVTKVQKQALHKLIVHGEYTPRPTKLVSDVSFHSDIYNRLYQLEYREAKRIQAYVWPAIFRYQHVCMVSGPQTGKTMGYLPVLLSFLLEKVDRYEPLLKASGPIFVILCANSRKCEDVYDLAKILLGRSKAKVSLVSYPVTHVNTRHMDFLITTPSVLTDLLKSKAITLKRLCHLVLEDGNQILERHTEITKVFALVQNMLQNRVCYKPVQLIVCGEHWSTRLESLVKKLEKTPLVCVGNYLEAALYGKVQFSMRFVNSACKEHELKNLLKETHRICKSVIVCKKDEVDDIETILMLKGIDATIIKENMSKEDILYLEEVWNSCVGGQYTVLVCTDFLLNTFLTVTSADLLIHYSLPVSWTKFVKRFSCLLENCRSPLDSKESKIKCQSVVLCDEACEEHMLKFFTFIDATELKYQLPEKFKTFSKDLKGIEEEKKLKSEVGLCETQKLFGSCAASRCVWRHILDKNLDVSNHLPQSGRLKFKIVNIQDVTKYSIELIRYVDMDNNVHELDNVVDVTSDLTDIMNISRKRIMIPVIGHLYAYHDMEESEGVYYRCELLDIENECVKIKLIDRGNIVSTVKTRLYRLPKEFNDTLKPRKIYDGILANLIPPYKDEYFSSRSFFHLKNLLQKYDYENIVLTGDIHLQLGNTLWLKDVHHEVVLSDKVVPKFQLTREILGSKLAIYSNEQLGNLYNLCSEASIQLPKYEKEAIETAKIEVQVVPQWAHLDQDAVSDVIFSAGISPDEVYIRLFKFNELLYTLQKEIQEGLRKPNYPKLRNVEVGTICLARDIDGQYARVMVLETDSDEKARCFYVDFGDETIVNISDLKYIHPTFISKLPFQTVQCKLHGIQPNLNQWQQEAIEVLYEYSMEPNTDIFRTLYLKPCSKEVNIIIPKQNRYSILLKDGFGEKKALINKLLVDCGMAVPNPDEEIGDFDVPEKSVETSESEEELEKIADIFKKTEEVEENFHYNDKQFETAGKEVEPMYEEMEVFLDDAVGFFNHLMRNAKPEPVLNTVRELPVQRAMPAVDYCTPEVWWSQTDKMVKIDVKLHDVENYTLNVKKGRILNFKTVKDDKPYVLKLMLYEKVEVVQHSAMGPQVRIKLTKSKDIEWPRLILTKQNARHIHYDVSTINVEESRKKFLELPKMSDDSDSDGENIDIMYHVSSDMDSDFDLELPHDSD